MSESSVCHLTKIMRLKKRPKSMPCNDAAGRYSRLIFWADIPDRCDSLSWSGGLEVWCNHMDRLP